MSLVCTYIIIIGKHPTDIPSCVHERLCETTQQVTMYNDIPSD